MTPEEFKALIDVHGSDLRKWPHDRRQAATALLERSDRAQSIFAEARDFDALLKADGPALGEGRRRALIDGVMDAIDTADPRADAQDRHRATEVGQGVGGAHHAGWGRWLPAGLPAPGTVAALAMAGVVLGVGLGLGLVTPAPLQPLYGGFALWLG